MPLVAMFLKAEMEAGHWTSPFCHGSVPRVLRRSSSQRKICGRWTFSSLAAPLLGREGQINSMTAVLEEIREGVTIDPTNEDH